MLHSSAAADRGGPFSRGVSIVAVCGKSACGKPLSPVGLVIYRALSMQAVLRDAPLRDGVKPEL